MSRAPLPSSLRRLMFYGTWDTQDTNYYTDIVSKKMDKYPLLREFRIASVEGDILYSRRAGGVKTSKSLAQEDREDSESNPKWTMDDWVFAPKLPYI